jgi:predicted PurR-regulated permease PerM
MSKPAAEKNGISAANADKRDREREAAERAGVEAARNGKSSAAAASFDAWARASHVALVGLFVIALLWCGYVAQPVIVPVLLAWVIATIVLPIVSWLQDRGMPRVLAVIALTLLLVVVIASLLILLSTPVAYWLGRASEIGVLLKQKLQTIGQPLALLEEMRKSLNVIGTGEPTLKVEQQSATVVTTIFSILTPAVSQFILFTGALVFYLTYQKRLRSTAVLLLRDRDARLATLRTLSDIDANMTRYFGAFTIVNAGLGVVTVALTWAVGLPNPLLWGVLAGVLNYVPYIGPAIVVATLSVVGLLTYSTLGEAMVAPLMFLGIVTVEGQFLTPTLIGRRLELNPFAIFLAVAFCTWLWGPLGAFLAVPLLMALAVTVGHAFADEKPELPA